jgi:FkbM family methyltransferase
MSIFSRLRRRFGLGQTILLGGVEIALPAEHLLPRYMSKHARYDRFIPHLVRHLKNGDLIVDVGANCGDTYAAMCAARPGAKFICLEPDPGFFAFLAANAARVAQAHAAQKPTLLPHMVGEPGAKKSLSGGGGTRISLDAADGVSTKSLDDILRDADQGKPRLIKSDVDGYDHDVLRSGLRTISAHRPLLFFECQCDRQGQLDAYREILVTLEGLGYASWTVFDNYGGVLLHDVGRAHVEQLLAYVWSQRGEAGTRTIWYLDVLAGSADDAPMVREAIRSYLG